MENNVQVCVSLSAYTLNSKRIPYRHTTAGSNFPSGNLWSLYCFKSVMFFSLINNFSYNLVSPHNDSMRAYFFSCSFKISAFLRFPPTPGICVYVSLNLKLCHFDSFEWQYLDQSRYFGWRRSCLLSKWTRTGTEHFVSEDEANGHDHLLEIFKEIANTKFPKLLKVH